MASPIMTAVGAAMNLAFNREDNLPEDVGAWNERRRELDTYWEWFTSEALDERATDRLVKAGGKKLPPLKYPLQINPIRTACRLHNYALWGEVEDTAAPMTELFVDGAEPAVSEAIQEAILRVAAENHFRTMQLDAGLASQALGGTVFKVSWDADDPFLPSGVRWEYADPRDFHARWSGTNYWRLEEAWLRYTITAQEARERYGIQVAGPTAEYLERWSPTEMVVTVDGRVATEQRTGRRLKEANEWGFVPLVYIPHERAGGFWGASMVKEAVGLTTELNSRLADLGDAVRLNPHGPIVAGNIPNGYPQVKTLADGTRYIDLGRTIVQGAEPPFMERMAAPQIPEGQMAFNGLLLELTRIALMTPDIAYGKEEGSQRSGQTLYSRMWPTLAHVKSERTNWTDGLNVLYEMTLRVLAEKGGKLGITEAHLGQRKRQQWAPMVPVDRAQLVDEIVSLAGIDAISPELMVQRLKHAPDPDEEIARVKAMRAEETEREIQKAKMQGDTQLAVAKLRQKSSTPDTRSE